MNLAVALAIAVTEILDEDALYRRLLPYYVKAGGRVSSAAYKRRGKVPESEISVDLARLTTPEETLRRAPSPSFALGSILTAVPRRLGLRCGTIRVLPRNQTITPTRSSSARTTRINASSWLRKRLWCISPIAPSDERQGRWTQTIARTPTAVGELLAAWTACTTAPERVS